jgi:hypothetical protein
MHTLKDNIKMDHGEIEYDWIRMDQDRIQWRTFLNTVMKFGLHWECVGCMTE